MLDSITKKNIDNCRDVLVGKVPDPKSQIEQITLALIYKFMDDMDKESVEVLKGKAKFFVGEFAKYGWRELFDPNLGGKEMLGLYSTALEKLQTNDNIPELFRNIFKNAYLPYKDPSTLRLFLKYINEFEYTHSEKLGDAFEYLLSVMSSQGDAGQFRTPRHVIDFIVACLDPKKNETIGDPACGTAGFLLSAYKYIVQQNTQKRLGDQLTPDQRKKMANNIIGYDISPDMVRLSLVNMYLHGFATPQIFEYDTLSSEDRWNETFDVILANPPFMTPTGGIRPHKKFGVQAKKAEVLFTNYIAEHLNKNGRAGIIVPNGIVATIQTAYKQLRKLLVEDSLIAVISLPAGCFNPYSNVKTSILLLDKSLAKKSTEVLFLKVNNDGYDLGAQRREIDKNDLPNALKAFNDFKQHLSDDSEFNPENYNDLCLLVEKDKILENKDVVLVVERYLKGKIAQTDFKLVKLSSVTSINKAASDPIKLFGKNDFFYFDIESVENGTGKLSFNKLLSPKNAPSRARRIVEDGDVIVSTVRPNLKAFAYLENLPKNCLASTGFAVISGDDTILGKYLIQVLRHEIAVGQMVAMSGKGQYPSITASDLGEIEIPLPPLSIQEEIVREIEGYQKIIDGAKMVVENYKPTITINPDWEMVELGEVCDMMTGGTPTSTKKEYYEGGAIKWLVSGDIHQGQIYDCEGRITELGLQNSNAKFLPINSVLIALNGQGKTRGTVAILRTKATCNQSLVSIYPKKDKTILAEFLCVQLQSKYQEIREMTGDKERSGLNMPLLRSIKVSLPLLEEQTQIVERIEQEQALVNANKQLIALFEQKIKDRINLVWGAVD